MSLTNADVLGALARMSKQLSEEIVFLSEGAWNTAFNSGDGGGSARRVCKDLQVSIDWLKKRAAK